jgi:hypothetical protein
MAARSGNGAGISRLQRNELRAMSSNESNAVLTPFQALARFGHELTLVLSSGRVVVTPGVIGTVFFERGSKPEVRQGILACFDRFDALFGQHLKGGKSTDLGKFSKKNAAGVEAIRKAIIETGPHGAVSVVRSSATDQDTAAEYEIGTLTIQDPRWPGQTAPPVATQTAPGRTGRIMQ